MSARTRRRATPASGHAGVVVLRPADQSRDAVIAFASRWLPDLSSVDLRGTLAVVRATGIKLRR